MNNHNDNDNHHSSLTLSD